MAILPTIDVSPTISNCIFLNNQTDPGYVGGGGAIYGKYSRATYDNCKFSENRNQYESGGGGIYLDSSCDTFISCAFVRNVNYSYSHGFGIL